MAEKAIDKWLTSVWFPYLAAAAGCDDKEGSPNLLIADSFAPHAAASVQRSLGSRQSCLAIIPSACSPILQPLHKGIKQKFKVHFDALVFTTC